MFIYTSQIPELPIDVRFERNPLCAEDQGVMYLSAPALITGGSDVPGYARPLATSLSGTTRLNFHRWHRLPQ